MRFEPGDLVAHFKRETLTEEERATNRYLYEIVGFATHTETCEPLVIYKALYEDGGLYARPQEMFESLVDKNKYPDIQQVYRFEKVDGKNNVSNG